MAASAASFTAAASSLWVVRGVHRLVRPLELILGSVSQHVAAYAQRPVTVVR